MERFARLCDDLYDARDDAERLARLCTYLHEVDIDDAALAAWLLGGNRPARVLTRTQLRDAGLRASRLPRWLFDACHRDVGNLAETIALVLPLADRPTAQRLSPWLHERLLPLAELAPDDIAARLADDWNALDIAGRIVYTKLVAGTFRSPVTKALVARALASVRGDGSLTIPASPTARDERIEIPRDDRLRVAAVLVYAERATPKGYALGKYTFAVWDERDGVRSLTPIAKLDIAAGGERSALDAVVRRTTNERFGPVRGVTPTLVCEIAFEAIERSSRHKSGLTLRSPRFLRRLPDRAIDDAATLASLHALLDAATG
jgi:hypothetical protein